MWSWSSAICPRFRFIADVIPERLPLLLFCPFFFSRRRRHTILAAVLKELLYIVRFGFQIDPPVLPLLRFPPLHAEQGLHIVRLRNFGSLQRHAPACSKVSLSYAASEGLGAGRAGTWSHGFRRYRAARFAHVHHSCADASRVRAAASLALLRASCSDVVPALRRISARYAEVSGVSM